MDNRDKHEDMLVDLCCLRETKKQCNYVQVLQGEMNDNTTINFNNIQ